MLKELRFTVMLSPDQKDRLRVTASKEKGKIVRFVAQYEFAHKDLIHPNGTTDKQPLPFTDFNVAFTFAMQDLKISWKWYRIAYEKEL